MAKAAKKPLTKTQILAEIADATQLSKKDEAAGFDALTAEIKKSLSRSGAGQFTVPGLLKIVKKKVEAKPAQKGVTNPFTGEIYDRPAKKAYNTVKVRPLKALKDMV